VDTRLAHAGSLLHRVHVRRAARTLSACYDGKVNDRKAPDQRTLPTPGIASVTHAIVLEHISKRYGNIQALDDLTLTVPAGQIFAVLGPNGAGKTTAVEILEGFRRADRGAVRVLGLNPHTESHQLKRQIGVVLQDDGVYPGLTARELLRLYAHFYPRPLRPDDVLARLGIGDVADIRCRRLSGGQKRRLALALALIGQPRLLFLDEPTTGMDPQARRTTWEIIREQRDKGTTVLLTTHLMDEAERLADTVAIIVHGRLVALGTPDALAGVTGDHQVRCRATAGLDCDVLVTLPGATRAREAQPGHYLFDVSSAPVFLAAFTSWCRDHDVRITELQVGLGSLEEVFLSITRGNQPS